MTDLICFKNGWSLSALVKMPKGYQATIEKEFPIQTIPHYNTRFKRGEGSTQREAVENATRCKGFVQR